MNQSVCHMFSHLKWYKSTTHIHHNQCRGQQSNTHSCTIVKQHIPTTSMFSKNKTFSHLQILHNSMTNIGKIMTNIVYRFLYIEILLSPICVWGAMKIQNYNPHVYKANFVVD